MSETPRSADTKTMDIPALEMAFAKDPTSDVFLALATAYLAQGRFTEAMVVCKKGIKSKPEDVQARLLLARVYAEQGKVPKALEEVKGLLATHATVADVHAYHGELLDKSGKSDEAIEAFKEALRQDRHNAAANAGLAGKGIVWTPGPSAAELAAAEAARVAAEEARKAAERERQIEAQKIALEAKNRAMAEAIAGSNKSGGAPMPMGGIDGYAGAYGMFSGPVPAAQARRFGPGFTVGLAAILLLALSAFMFLLWQHRKSQDQITEHLKAAQKYVAKDTTRGHRQALKDLKEAIKLDDHQAMAVSQYALSLEKLVVERGDRDLDTDAKAAVAAAAKVAKSHPNSVAAQMMAARDEGKAEESVKLAHELGTDDAALPIPVRTELGRAYAMLGKIPEMVKVAESLKDIPDSGALWFAGEAFRRVGDRGRARVALDSAMKNELDHDPARAERALLILELDDVPNLPIAIDDLNSLKDLGKDGAGTNQLGYANLGLALMARKLGRDDREYDANLGAAKKALRTDPEIPLFEARVALSQGEFEKAENLAREAIKQDRVRLAPYLALSEAAARDKKWDVANQALVDAQAVFGDNLDLGLARGDRLRDQEKFDECLQALNALAQKFDVAEVYRDIGKTLIRKGDLQGASEALKKATEKAQSRSPSIKANVMTWLGRVYAESGDHAEAIKIYSEALSISADYPSTYFFLGLSALNLEDGQKARDAFRRYLKVDPTGPYAAKAKEKLEAQ